jgi:2-oxoglutarate ferredoxin oxidoreductase subunit gamma
MKKKNFKIIIAGEGGQGVQSIAHAFANAAFEAGLNITFMPNYGVEQRGGVSLGFLQFGQDVIGFPKINKADILVVMCERAILRTEIYLDKKTLYIYDADLIESRKLASIPAEKLPVPATSVASDKLDPKVFNMILAGAILSETPILKQEHLEKGLEKVFADKYKQKPQLRNLNKRALQLGQQLAKDAYVK